MNLKEKENAIRCGHTSLGIEFGSTRIKAVLISDSHDILAQSCITWENKLENGIWTYSLTDARENLQKCYALLKEQTEAFYHIPLTTVGMIGISGMMHGLLALDEEDRLVVPFRTWRNTMTKAESEMLTALFGCTIPQRWSVAHLCQLMRNDAKNAKRIKRMTTLAGYFHYILTGEHILGCCEAAGMFPVDGQKDTPTYFSHMTSAFDMLAHTEGMPWSITELLPRVVRAGERGGCLTSEGAHLLDPTGELGAGIPFCPPEGDGGTGMVCTCSLAPGMASISAGTSAFGLFVLDKPFPRAIEEIEVTVTPSGFPCAQLHGNNGTSELDAWADLIASAVKQITNTDTVDTERLYEVLLGSALENGANCSGIVVYNYLSGEHLTGVPSGRPMYLRTADSTLNLQSFMRAQLFSVFAPLAHAFTILRREGVLVKQIRAQGGLFRTKGAAQRVLAAAFRAPVTVNREAGEGGSFGMALLAAYAKNKADGQTLEDYIGAVFENGTTVTEEPDEQLTKEYHAFLAQYMNALPLEQQAAKHL
ncbi:MAG: ATPase [Clostridia bacterium]|nr:ATPase [Clostridia bacterium]